MSLSLNVPILMAKILNRLQVYKISMSLPSTFTTDLRLAKIVETELSKRALKYTQFELKSIVIQENKLTRLI